MIDGNKCARGTSKTYFNHLLTFSLHSWVDPKQETGNCNVHLVFWSASECNLGPAVVIKINLGNPMQSNMAVVCHTVLSEESRAKLQQELQAGWDWRIFLSLSMFWGNKQNRPLSGLSVADPSPVVHPSGLE